MSGDIKQQILVPYDFSEASENALIYGAELATWFKCEISLIFALKIPANNKTNTGEEQIQEIKNKMTVIAGNIISGRHIMVNVYVFKEKIHNVINRFYEKINGIICVCGLNEKKNNKYFFSAMSLVSDYRNLRIPLLIVNEQLPKKSMFSNMILPIDFNRESKEKAVWAGYISTLNKSTVTIVIRDYKDQYFSASLRNNIALIQKLYNNLGVNYSIVREKNISVSIEKYAVEYAGLNDGDLLVITATKEIAVDDLLFGLAEKKIIINKYKLPVLLVNPRDDLYIPCGC